MTNPTKHDLMIKAVIEVNAKRLWASLSRQAWNDCYFSGDMEKRCEDGPMLCTSKIMVTKLWEDISRWN